MKELSFCCPECGSEESTRHDELGPGFRVCVSCNREWWADIDYTQVGYKLTNPKDAIGIRKPPQSTVPQNVMAEIGVGMMEGGMKYGRHNYRVVGVRASVYYDATRRHIDSWWEGEDLDPDSGLSHITKAITALVVLRDAMLQNKLTDDRPPKSDVAGHREYLTKIVEKLFEKYPEPKEAYTEKGA